ncbi:MAG: LOG family protein [Anaerolineales bacterium]|nr:LOG family protein [Anaerolineales bacterium]
MKVSIFGGAGPAPGSPAYQEAFELGRLLANAGHTVLTGGYIGTMEAASRGAAESGGHVIGVTCDEIEQWRGVRANAWVREEWHKQTLIERLTALVQECDAAIALSGGPGTLVEVALTWNLMIIESLPAKPLILVGDRWKQVLDQFFAEFNTYMPANQRDLVAFVPDVNAAVARLRP